MSSPPDGTLFPRVNDSWFDIVFMVEFAGYVTLVLPLLVLWAVAEAFGRLAGLLLWPGKKRHVPSLAEFRRDNKLSSKED